MKNLILTIALLISISGSSQKFESLFQLDTLDENTIQFQPIRGGVFVNESNPEDSVEIAPIIMYYKDDFARVGVMLHGFWVSRTVTDTISIYFGNNTIKIGECKSSKESEFKHKIFTPKVLNISVIKGISNKIVIGNKVYIGKENTRSKISLMITGFNKLTADWYE